MRSCMGWIRSLGSVVMTVKLSTLPPSGLDQTSHNPAKANQLKLLLVALFRFGRLTNNPLYGHSSNLASPQANPAEFDPVP